MPENRTKLARWVKRRAAIRSVSQSGERITRRGEPADWKANNKTEEREKYGEGEGGGEEEEEGTKDDEENKIPCIK